MPKSPPSTVPAAATSVSSFSPRPTAIALASPKETAHAPGELSPNGEAAYNDYGMTANVCEGLQQHDHDAGDSSSDGLLDQASCTSEFPSASKAQQRKRLILIGVVSTVVTTVVAVCIYLAFMARRRGCQSSPTDACGLQCGGILLQTIQFSGLFNDSKTFVDMPMVQNPQCVLDEFNSLDDYSPASLFDFVDRNFEPSCSDMLLWMPPDFQLHPAFLKDIPDKIVREWAYDVNLLWSLLGRQVSSDVYENPLRHTLLPLRSPHMIVPGGRFCEFYYWDSYWILQGLLVSGMYSTAKGMVDNFLGLVQDFGFVPNGSRKYYLNRSQPPMLTLMVKEIVDAQGDVAWLKSILPTLEVEYQYWMQPGKRALQVEDTHGQMHTLNRYYSDSIRPRPESYVADSLTAWLLHNMTSAEKAQRKANQPPAHLQAYLDSLNFSAIAGVNTLNEARLYQTTAEYRNLSHYSWHGDSSRSPPSTTSSSPTLTPDTPPPPPVPDFSNSSTIRALFAQLTAGAESGWDFSSRWFHDRSNLTSVETMDLIPVDLNAILFKVEQQLSGFFALVGDSAKSQQYALAAQARLVAIQAILWNGAQSQWQDYHIDLKYWKHEVMVSNWIPLWAKCYDPAVVDEASVISALLQSGLVMAGGIVTTLNNNTQQWDFPNAWAPLQWFIVRGINTSVYESSSTIDNFSLYNSTALPKGATPPPHACDVVRPDTWYNCSSKSCTWCFPDPTSLASALSLRWIYSNILAFNETGYMLEKYFAPIPGGLGAGGEYKLQKGFGWTNGVALDFVTRLAQTQPDKLTIAYLSQQPFPYSEMAASVDTSPLVPEHPPHTISAQPIAKNAKKYDSEREDDTRRSKKKRKHHGGGAQKETADRPDATGDR